MGVTRATIASVSFLSAAAIFLSGCQAQKPAVMIVIDSHRQGTAPGNSPVKIVGGSMTFRSSYKWASQDGLTWTTSNNPLNVIAVQLEDVVSSSCPAGNVVCSIVLGLQSGWSIEVDGTTKDGSADSSHNVTVTGASNQIQIAVNGTGAKFSYSGTYAPDAPSKGVPYYYGVRYWYDCKMDSTTQGSICDKISQIQVTSSTGSKPVAYSCPTAECRADIITTP